MELKEKRTDLYHVTLENVVVVDGFNIRKDYGDISALAESIEKNGILKPLDAYKKDGKYYLVDGHRRIEAVKKLAEKGINILIPIRPESKGISEEQRIINMVVANDSKPLNYVEMAEVVVRLQNYGWSDKEICDKLCWSQPQISFLRTLNTASHTVKDYVSNGYISAAEAVNLVRNNPEDAVAIIELAIEDKFGSKPNAIIAESGNGKKKRSVVTKKDINKVIGKNDSIKSFKQLLKLNQVPEMNLELFNVLKRVIDGDITDNELYEMFYNPVNEEIGA